MVDDSLAICRTSLAMTAAGDEDTFAERLLTAPQAVLRWASLAPSTGRENARSSLGCLSPLTLLKIVVGLLIVVLLPLCMLPLPLALRPTIPSSSRAS